jgi:ArsR family transcriptional regulator
MASRLALSDFLDIICSRLYIFSAVYDMKVSVMEAGSYRRATKLFHLLSHRARLRILDELRRGEACVCHLQAALGRPQVYVSQQLRVLREAGVIESYKEGTFVFYRLIEPLVERLLAEAMGPADQSGPVHGCECPRCGGTGCSG